MSAFTGGVLAASTHAFYVFFLLVFCLCCALQALLRMLHPHTQTYSAACLTAAAVLRLLLLPALQASTIMRCCT